MSTSNPNRNKFLLGFSAVVAVLIVAFFLWPANIQKDDASGTIGAVQKHHAPQITQADVILGGESVKHEQKVLSTDFLADAAKLRSIAASRDVAQARILAREVQSRYMAEARLALDRANAAARLSGEAAQMQSEIAELNMMIANKATLNDQEMAQFGTRLHEVVEAANRQNANARLGDAEQALAHMSLDNEQAASRLVSDVEQAFSRIDANVELADEEQYLGMMQLEARVLSNEEQAQARFTGMAEQLEQRAQLNVRQAADREEQMGMRLQRVLNDVESAASRTTANRAGVLGAEESLSARLGALAARLNQRQSAAREIVAMRQQLDARQK
jgi:hypothetical protein